MRVQKRLQTQVDRDAPRQRHLAIGRAALGRRVKGHVVQDGVHVVHVVPLRRLVQLRKHVFVTPERGWQVMFRVVGHKLYGFLMKHMIDVFLLSSSSSSFPQLLCDPLAFQLLLFGPCGQ